MPRALAWLRSWIALAAFLAVPVAYAAPIQITVDTSSLAGTSAILAFDFIDGGTPVNSVTLSGFSTDGTVGTSSATGDVTGAFPGTVTLADTSFFNEYLQNLTLGNSLTFVFNTTGNPADPASFPDAFSFFLLNDAGTASLLTTDDPTGANAIFLYNIGEANPLVIYTADGVTVTAGPVRGVPAPNTLLLAITALVILGLVISFVLRRRAKTHPLMPA